MIAEVLPGVLSWSAFHEGIRNTVHSSFVVGSGTLIDPMEPEEGLEAIGRHGIPQRIVLSNRHHYRHSARFAQRFDCPVLCHEAGLHEFSADRSVRGFAFGDRLAGDVRALRLAGICPEETALLIEAPQGALSFADGLTRGRDGSLTFMPDRLLGDDPRAVSEALSANLRALLTQDFDALLFAHAEPVLSGGHDLLTDFLSV